MKHPIDPKVDCVFKAILGSAEHLNLSLNFLNALLEAELPSPLVELELLNPYNEKEFLSDKLSKVAQIAPRCIRDKLRQWEPAWPARRRWSAPGCIPTLEQRPFEIVAAVMEPGGGYGA